MIQASQDQVQLQFNKLICDTKKGKTLDIKLKKIKHKIVEGLDASTADALGISRAILCNDSLIRKLKGLDQKVNFEPSFVSWDFDKDLVFKLWQLLTRYL